MATDRVEVDLEKGIVKEAMGTPDDAQLPAMAGGEEKEPMIPDLRIPPVEGGAVAGGSMNPGQKKWRRMYWLLVLAASAIVVDSHIHAAPKDELFFPPGLAMFVTFLCAICLVLQAMKQMM